MYQIPKFKFVVSFFLLAFVFFSANQILALEEKAEPSPATLIADVNIYNAKIDEQSGSSFKISFDLSNGVGSQTGVKYSVKLLSVGKDGKQTISDEKVFDDEVSLPQNSVIPKNIIYTAPSNLDGKYKMMIFVNNESGFPFGLGTLGDVTLKALDKGLQISTDSCFLNVVGEKGSPKYTVSQGVDIGFDEKLSLSCLVTNTSKKAVQATTFYEMTELSSFGDVAGMYDTDIKTIDFKASEKKVVTVTLPKSPMPNMYVTRFGLLAQGAGLSNTVSVSYMLRGLNANIQNASLDKDQYNTGENATLSLIWSTRAGGSRMMASALGSVISAETKLTDGGGKMCADATTSELKYESDAPVSKLSLPIKNVCRDPKLEITLLGSQKEKLDSKTFAFKTLTPAQEELEKLNTKEKTKNYGLIAIAILVGLAILAIVMKLLTRKPKVINKVDGTPNGVKPAVSPTNKPSNPSSRILPVLFFFMMLFGFGQSAHAGTYSMRGLLMTIDYDQASYVPGSSGTVNLSVSSSNVPSGVTTFTNTISTINLGDSFPGHPIINGTGGRSPYFFLSGSAGFTMPSTPNPPVTYVPTVTLRTTYSGNVPTDAADRAWICGFVASYNMSDPRCAVGAAFSFSNNTSFYPSFTVAQPPQPPTVYMTANRCSDSSTPRVIPFNIPPSCTPGSPTTITWNANNARSCTFSGPGISVTTTCNVSSSCTNQHQVSPSSTSDYSVTCTN